ncbi:MAG: type II toxin-antitoxin system MqsR family toxin [Rhizobiales bacterium]|nr:type II toxin-antitoxin system MqsR family toxin [Hyphomicrobiales bacterium]
MTGFAYDAAVSTTGGLTCKDFYESMTVRHDGKLWQGVFLPICVIGKKLYLKFTKDAQGNRLLISFEGSES